MYLMGHFSYMLWPQNSILSVIQVGPRLLGVCRNNRGQQCLWGAGEHKGWENLRKSLPSVTLAGTQGLPYCVLLGAALPAPFSSQLLLSCSCTWSSSLLPFFCSHDHQAPSSLDLSSLCALLRSAVPRPSCTINVISCWSWPEHPSLHHQL